MASQVAGVITDGAAVGGGGSQRAASTLQTETLLVAQKRSLEMVVRGAPLGDVLTYLTRIVEQHAGPHAVAAILLLDAQGCLRPGAAPSLPPDYSRALDGLEASEEVGTCSAAAATGRVVVTPDIAADPKWAKLKSLPLALGLRAAWSQPILARSGRVLGTLGTYFRECREPTALERQLVGVLSHTAALAIERQEVDASLEEQRRLLDTALNAAEMGAWRYCISDRVCEFSRRAQRLYGLDAARLPYDEDGVRSILHAQDIPGMWEAMGIASDPTLDGRYSVEYRVRRREGGWRWLSVWGIAEFVGEGESRRPVAIVGASRDISDRKEAEAQQRLLIDELSHRVKNTLAIVQSIAAQTLRHKPEPAAFNAAFSARVAALAQAHDLLIKGRWQGTPLETLVSTTLRPFGGDLGHGTVRIDGPSILIKPNAAVTLCLVFHELATNAAKHGALTTPHGRISVVWKTIAGEPGEPTNVDLCWREEDGPSVDLPKGRGFGSRLIEASAIQLGGDVALGLERDGVVCRFRFPLGENIAA